MSRRDITAIRSAYRLVFLRDLWVRDALERGPAVRVLPQTDGIAMLIEGHLAWSVPAPPAFDPSRPNIPFRPPPGPAYVAENGVLVFGSPRPPFFAGGDPERELAELGKTRGGGVR